MGWIWRSTYNNLNSNISCCGCASISNTDSGRSNSELAVNLSGEHRSRSDRLPSMICSRSKRVHMLLVLLLPLLLQTVAEASYSRMVSPGHEYVMNKGDSVVLSCEFELEYFRLFNYPVVWWKSQRDEQMQVNLMGFINKPFNQEGRIEVSFINLNKPRYNMELTIEDLSREDSGNYTCNVMSAESGDVLATVTHHVYVRASVVYTYITNGNETIIDDNTQQPPLLEFVEYEPTTLRCMTHGGYPPPDILMYLGEHDVTQEMALEMRTQLTGEPGMRLITSTIELSSHSIMPVAEYDGKDAECIVTVLGMMPQIKKVQMAVRYGPIIKCKSKRVKLKESNVFIKCDITAKPSAKAAYWILDPNGTTVKGHGTVDDWYWNINSLKDDDGRLESKLFIRRIRHQDFRTYTIIAENEVSSSTQYVTLSEKYKPTPKPTTKGTLASKSSSDANSQTGYTYFDHSSGAVRCGQRLLHCAGLVLTLLIVRNQRWPA